MKRLTTLPSLIEAQLTSDFLAQAGIPNRILNTHATGALGEVPFLEAEPQLWIEDDRQFDRALTLLADFARAPRLADRVCPACGEVNPGQFLACWHCGQALASQN